MLHFDNFGQTSLINPLLHRYSFLQQMTFENTVTKEDIAPATMFSKLSNFRNVHFFHQDFSKCRLLQDCCMGKGLTEKKVNIKYLKIN